MTIRELLTRRTAILSASASLAAACCTRPRDETGACARAIGSPAGRPASKPLPFAVQEIYPAAHRDRIHIAGGLLSDGTAASSASPIATSPMTRQTQTTTELAALPARRHHPHAVEPQGQLYLLGGFGTTRTRVTWIMSDATRCSIDDAAMPGPPLTPAPEPHAEVVGCQPRRRASTSSAGASRRARPTLAYGDHEDTDRHLVFDPAANSVEQSRPRPHRPQQRQPARCIDGLWHVVGGRSVAGGPTDAHEVYDAEGRPLAQRGADAERLGRGRQCRRRDRAASSTSSAANISTNGGRRAPRGLGNTIRRPTPGRSAADADAAPRPRRSRARRRDLAGRRREAPSGSETSDVVERFRLGG